MAWIAGSVCSVGGLRHPRCFRENKARNRRASGADSEHSVCRREAIVGSSMWSDLGTMATEDNATDGTILNASRDLDSCLEGRAVGDVLRELNRSDSGGSAEGDSAPKAGSNGDFSGLSA